jgi:phospholipase C
MSLFNFTTTTPNAALYLDSNTGTKLASPPGISTTPSL